jgi:hypothetical protein
VPHLHTHGHRAIRRRARRARGRPLCADAGTMQSPMQFRAIQVRLVPSANDTVTVYPSPTHTRTIARENHRPRMQRVHATTLVPAAGCSRPSRPALRVCAALSRGRRMRDDLRLLLEWPPRRKLW